MTTDYQLVYPANKLTIEDLAGADNICDLLTKVITIQQNEFNINIVSLDDNFVKQDDLVAQNYQDSSDNLINKLSNNRNLFFSKKFNKESELLDVKLDDENYKDNNNKFNP